MSPDTTGIYLFNYNDSTVLKTYNLNVDEKMYISNDDLYLYICSDDAVNMIQLDWTVGVPQYNEHDYNLNIKPNPAGDYIEIDVGANGRSPLQQNEIRVYNSIGECVLEVVANVETLHATSLRIDTSELPPGIYFLRCGGQCAKFVKM
jgi:hypothetical protein